MLRLPGAVLLSAMTLAFGAALLQAGGCGRGLDTLGGTRAAVSRSFVYTSNFDSKSISAFRVEAGTETLTAITGVTGLSATPLGMTQTANGGTLFVGAAGVSGLVYSFLVDRVTGALTSGSGSPMVLPNAGSPFFPVLDPSESILFALAAGKVFGITLAAGDSTQLTLASTVNLDDPIPVGSAIDPAGRFLYSVGLSNHLLIRQKFDSATRSVVKVDTTDAGNVLPSIIMMHPGGRYFFLTGGKSPGWLALGTLAEDGSVTAITQITNLAGEPSLTALDSAGRFFYVPVHDQETVNIYSFDVATGTLSVATPSVCVLPPGSGPNAIVLSPSGTMAYVASRTASRIDIFNRDPNTGSLTPATPSSIATGVDVAFLHLVKTTPP